MKYSIILALEAKLRAKTSKQQITPHGQELTLNRCVTIYEMFNKVTLEATVVPDLHRNGAILVTER